MFDWPLKSIRSLRRGLITTIGVTFLCSVIFFNLYSSGGQVSYYSSRTISVELGGSEVRQDELSEENKYLPLKLAGEQIARMEPAPKWTYKCVDDTCVRSLVSEEEEKNDAVALTSLEVCWLTCGYHGPLWPYPRNHTSLRLMETVSFYPNDIQVEVKVESEPLRNFVMEAYNLKKSFLENYPGLKKSKDGVGFLWFFPRASGRNSEAYGLKLVLEVRDELEMFQVGKTDESYEIKIEEKGNSNEGSTSYNMVMVRIRARTFFGVRHGLETFSQLVGLDSTQNCLRIVKSFTAYDGPRYPYRGILIDSARNFLPLPYIKRVIDAMGQNKMNILHWHLTESNSFTFYSKRVPQMTAFGAFPEEIYYPEEISQLIQYARLRGVKIIPELDAPSHAGNGWQFGEKYGLGTLAFYVNEYGNSWRKLCGQPPCGILNPINPNTYNVLGEIFADMLEVFEPDMFHMGGDEVKLESWTKIPELNQWLGNKDGIELWKHFQDQALARLKGHSPNVSAILWTSKLTESELNVPFLDPKDYIIQVWEDMSSPQIMGLLRRGFRLILSFVDALYLDWGGGTWLGREHIWKYHNWQTIYDVKFNSENKDRILGGEAPIWGEKIGPDNLETRLWPRASALAEKLWCHPARRLAHVYSRLNFHTYRMRKRGVPASLLQPESCLHFAGHCHTPGDEL